MKKLLIVIGGFFVVTLTSLIILATQNADEFEFAPATPVTPNWDTIAAWPPTRDGMVDAIPDPGRNYTAIVLDDSGSMGSDIIAARAAVLSAREAMGPDDRLTVIALNAEEVIPFMTASDAAGILPQRLEAVNSTGSTPLTRAIRASRDALAAEAAVAGGFGTFRILVTTDGAADDNEALEAEIEDIARNTPIQIATIGVGIRGRHVLRRSDLAAFVAIDDVSELAAALRTAIAEEQNFSAMTSFGDP